MIKHVGRSCHHTHYKYVVVDSNKVCICRILACFPTAGLSFLCAPTVAKAPLLCRPYNSPRVRVKVWSKRPGKKSHVVAAPSRWTDICLFETFLFETVPVGECQTSTSGKDLSTYTYKSLKWWLFRLSRHHSTTSAIGKASTFGCTPWIDKAKLILLLLTHQWF